MRQYTKNRWKICVLALILLASSNGCASLVAKTPKTVLLQDEQVYTIPAGQEISVELDHKLMTLTFPYPMKLMSIDRAIRDEQMKNDATLKGIKADGEKKTLMTIIITILSIIGGSIGIFFAVKIKGIWPKIKLETK